MNTSIKRYWNLLVAYLRPERFRVALLTALLLGSIGLQLANPLLLRRFIDSAISGGSQRTLIVVAALFIVVALLTQGLSVCAVYLSEQVAWKATNLMRSDLLRHCLRLDMPFHHTHAPGQMIERIDGDVTALSKFFSQLVVQIIGSGVLLLGVLVVLWLEDWRVGAALTVFALVALGVLLLSRNIAVAAMTADREAHANLFGLVEERIAGLDDVRSNGGGSYVMRRLHAAMRDVAHKGRTAVMKSANIWVLTMTLFALGHVLSLGLGAYFYQAGSISIGTVYLFFQYTEMLRRPLQQISEQLQEFQRAAAGISRVQELLAMQTTIHDGSGIAFVPNAPAVEFDRVRFCYNDDAATIDNLSFMLERGKILGLLGRTGSGKTTLTRLLFRLYDPQVGTIRINGGDLRDLKLHDLRQQIGIVTQDVQLFQGTVRDNLTLFDATISDARIVAALTTLGLDLWLQSLPNGLDTELQAGAAGLSAGEAQLLAFARVFLRNPAIVILDEASSRLDPATENRIERAVDTLMQGRTGIIIAHRLKTVQRADDILILEHGRILEYGPQMQLADAPDSRFAHLLRVGMEEVLV